jgi:hypothetical protein
VNAVDVVEVVAVVEVAPDDGEGPASGLGATTPASMSGSRSGAEDEHAAIALASTNGTILTRPE